MNPRVLVVVGGILAVAGGILTLSGDEKPREVGDAIVEPSKLVRSRDGGKAYVVAVRVGDGGIEVRTTAPDCVRRRAGAAVIACRMRLPDGGVRDPGALNRFAADAAVGLACQPVACSVMAGEDADEEEDSRISRQQEAK